MATLAEIADHLDLSIRSVSTLKREGVIPAAGRGAHDLDAVRVSYIQHLREAAAGRSAAYGELDLTAERARLARAQAAKCERQNAIADGKFLEVAVVHRLVTGSFARVRAKMLSLAGKLAPLLAPAMTEAKAQGMLKDDIYAALNELATPPVGNWDTRNCIWMNWPPFRPDTWA